MRRRKAIAMLFWHHRREGWNRFNRERLGRYVWPDYSEEEPKWPCL